MRHAVGVQLMAGAVFPVSAFGGSRGPWGLVAPATDTSLEAQVFDAFLEASGSGTLSRLIVHANVGEATHDNWRYKAVAYTGHANFGGYNLVDAIAVREDGGDLMVIYAYCSAEDDSLLYVWPEGYGQAGTTQATTGMCRLQMVPGFRVHTQLPALRALPKPVDVRRRVSGDQVHLGPRGGWIMTRKPGGFDATNQTLTPFGLVDCSSCPGGPWLEVHSMLDTAPEGACFGILYIFPEKPFMVELGNSVCMPSLDRVDATYQVFVGDVDSAVQVPVAAETPPTGQNVAVWPSFLPRRPPPSMVKEEMLI